MILILPANYSKELSFLMNFGHAIITLKAHFKNYLTQIDMAHLTKQDLRHMLKKVNLQTWLFFVAILLYLATRLIGLADFPIFFFTDEAIQSVAAADLVANHLHDPNGIFLPTYFENGSQYNLGLSVYWQVIPQLLFGRSILVTRGAAVVATLLAAVFLGLILRDFFKVQHWWLGPLLLAVTPAWFLHSRTAFETTLMASLYAGFLYVYLSYRYKDPKYLYPTFILGALAFYAYSPGQVVIVVTGLFLIFSDLRYHWQQRKTVLPALLFLGLLAAPYFRFRLTQGIEIQHHLQQLHSYWVEPIPLHEKLWQYLLRYFKGLNPLYWYLPNDVDLIRHRMKDMGHFLLTGFPFLMVGLFRCFKYFKKSEYRALVFSLLAAPAGAAIVDIAITRLLVLVVPATLLTALGVEWFLQRLIKYRFPLKVTGLVTFGFLAATCIWMLREVLVNGPTWYDDYGLYGMQYGGQTLFAEIKAINTDEPERKIILSPSWANGADVIARYFLGDSLPITIGTIEEYAMNHLPLDPDTLFIMLPNEYTWMLETKKFTDIEIAKTLPCPDGTPCFYFVSLGYVPEIDQILAEEIALRRQLQESEILLFDKTVRVQYPLLDINQVEQAFDGDEETLIRTFEANPLRIILTFPEPIEMRGLAASVGGASTRVTVRINPRAKGETIEFSKEVGESNTIQIVDLAFGSSYQVESMEIEVFSINDPEIAHVHLWEIKFR